MKVQKFTTYFEGW